MSSNLEQLMEFAYKILRIRFGDEIFLMNNTNLAYILTSDPDEIKNLKERILPWVVVLGIAGRDRLPKERVSYQSRDIADIARQCGLEMEREIPFTGNKELSKIIFNHSSDPYWKLRYKDECRDIFFLTTLNKAPKFINKMCSVLDKYNYDAADMGVYLQPVQQGASCHCEFILPFDSENDWKVSRMKDLYHKASEELSNLGAFYSRPYGSWASIAFNRDAQTTRIVKELKSIFDPNNIMNPGKLCF
jgi:FAD/FMN-containing dehydrogenase